MITKTFGDSTEDFVNPERGFYVGLDLVAGNGATAVRNGGHTLALAIVRLDSYRDKALDSALLAKLEAGFADARAHGIKVILRFAYNSSFTADASKSRILGHITQLAPVMTRNADVISVLQAGFIGAWGEWHSSTNGLDNTADRTEILNALLAALPASRSIQVRTPMFKAESFPGGSLDENEAWNGSQRARIGHHNDCFLASASDLGTYASPVATWESFMAQEGRFTPVGGETCQVNSPRTDCAAAIAEMKANHWSYLNLQYHQAVLGAWEAQGCMEQVKRRLGYRFRLTRVSHAESVTAGGQLPLEIELTNEGFATPFNARPVYVVLSDGATRHVVELTDVDPRAWEPGAPVIFSASVPVPAEVASGKLKVSLWLPDAADSLQGDPRYAMRLANEGVWDEENGENVLVPELRVENAPPAKGPLAAR